MASNSYVALLLVGCLALASAGPNAAPKVKPAKPVAPTTYTLTLWTGDTQNGAKLILKGTFKTNATANFTTFDFSGLQAQGPAKKGVPQKVALDNTVKSFSLVAKGPNSKSMSLKFYSDSCATATQDTVVYSTIKLKETLPGSISGKASAVAVLMNNAAYDWGCYVAPTTSTNDTAIVDCLKTPTLPECNTPQICCVKKGTNVADYYQSAKCPNGFNKVPCDRRLRRYHRRALA
mmetsp:Transcript_145/g.320  ORF Transcript_145/g.320 Transcript_145/m.320 type:complete len:234 (-) Transcript_145:809-1510(-)